MATGVSFSDELKEAGTRQVAGSEAAGAGEVAVAATPESREEKGTLGYTSIGAIRNPAIHRTISRDFSPPGSPRNLAREQSVHELYKSARHSFGGRLRPAESLQALDHPVRRNSLPMVIAQDWEATNTRSTAGGDGKGHNQAASGKGERVTASTSVEGRASLGEKASD